MGGACYNFTSRVANFYANMANHIVKLNIYGIGGWYRVNANIVLRQQILVAYSGTKINTLKFGLFAAKAVGIVYYPIFLVCLWLKTHYKHAQ